MLLAHFLGRGLRRGQLITLLMQFSYFTNKRSVLS